MTIVFRESLFRCKSPLSNNSLFCVYNLHLIMSKFVFYNKKYEHFIKQDKQYFKVTEADIFYSRNDEIQKFNAKYLFSVSIVMDCKFYQYKNILSFLHVFLKEKSNYTRFLHLIFAKHSLKTNIHSRRQITV